MIKVAAALVAGAFLIGAAAEPVWDWGDATDEWSGDYRESKAVCRALKGREPPASDRPSPAQAAALGDCDSEALFYGIGMAADPERARQCAFLEADSAEEGTMQAPFTGRAMLMTIYANGVGARRDLDIATHLACGIDGAPAESDGRVRHLQELKAKGWAGSDFHFCDDVTSGLAMGWCAAHGARIGDAKRESRLAALTTGWSGADMAAFARLRAAQQAYAEAHADGEVDATGTMRTVFWVGARGERDAEFLELVERLASGRLPPGSKADFAAADRALNAAYRTRLAALGREAEGTVAPDGVRAAQRAWLRYRDAALAVAAARFPAVPRDSVAALLTRERTLILLGEGKEG